ncbi:MAG: hypothetical protein SD837_02950 [Candidatus Electrothrix scaldis]|nr:MAG: hypothetical protein SD837_02950 [Candidatus Electrothrix sp. GW3-3]
MLTFKNMWIGAASNPGRKNGGKQYLRSSTRKGDASANTLVRSSILKRLIELRRGGRTTTVRFASILCLIASKKKKTLAGLMATEFGCV